MIEDVLRALTYCNTLDIIWIVVTAPALSTHQCGIATARHDGAYKNQEVFDVEKHSHAKIPRVEIRYNMYLYPTELAYQIRKIQLRML